MPRRIKEDYAQFREVVTAATRERIKTLLKQGTLFKNRRVAITIPQMDLPPFLFGHVIRKPRPTEPVDWIKEGF